MYPPGHAIGSIKGGRMPAYPSTIYEHLLSFAFMCKPQGGYWRVLLCHHRKEILCPDPIVQLISASSTPSSLRDASSGNLSLGTGASILSQLDTARVQGEGMPPTARTITTPIQSEMSCQSATIAQEPGTIPADEAPTNSSAQERLDAVTAAYDTARHDTYDSVVTD